MRFSTMDQVGLQTYRSELRSVARYCRSGVEERLKEFCRNVHTFAVSSIAKLDLPYILFSIDRTYLPHLLPITAF